MLDPYTKKYGRDAEEEKRSEIMLIKFEEEKWAKDVMIERWHEKVDEDSDQNILTMKPSMLPIDVIDENDEEGSSMYESETDSEEILDVDDSVVNEESKEMTATIVS